MATRDDTAAELWRPIQIAPDYEVSSLGRVRRRTHGRRPGQCRAGSILKCSPDDYGYPAISLRTIAGGYVKFQVHRLMAITFYGPPPTPKHEAAHWNDKKSDLRLSNIRWATREENIADAMRNGRRSGPRGETHPKAKLTAEKVLAIRNERNAGATYVELGKKYGVSANSARAAAVGKKWRHVK